jgi:hypothetical protein
LTNRNSSSGPKKGRNPEIEACVLEYFRDLQYERLPVARKAMISKAKECSRNNTVFFKASCG